MSPRNPRLPAGPAAVWGRAWSLGIAFAVVAAVPAAFADGIAVEGRDRAILRLPPDLVVESYANEGYRLRKLGEGLVEVEVRVTPVASSKPWSAPGPDQASGTSEPLAKTEHQVPRPPQQVLHLTRAVAAGAKSEYQVASRVLAWVSRNLRYELDRSQDQGPEAVLERRTAYCTGAARLTVAMLQAAGLEAREVAGVVVGASGTVTAPGFHRWVEIHFGDRGWVYSDPLASHHFVAATYVRLADPQVPSPNLREAAILEREEGLAPVDLYPGSADGVLGRRNARRQLAGVLRVLGPSSPGARAILEGQGQRRELALGRGEATFVGVEPGDYTLRVTGSPLIHPRREYRIQLEDRGRAEALLPGADPRQSVAQLAPETPTPSWPLRQSGG